MKDYDYPSRAGFGIPEILEDPLPVRNGLSIRRFELSCPSSNHSD